MDPLAVDILIRGIVHVVVLAILLAPACKARCRKRRTSDRQGESQDTHFRLHIHSVALRLFIARFYHAFARLFHKLRLNFPRIS